MAPKRHEKSAAPDSVGCPPSGPGAAAESPLRPGRCGHRPPSWADSGFSPSLCRWGRGLDPLIGAGTPSLNSLSDRGWRPVALRLEPCWSARCGPDRPAARAEGECMRFAVLGPLEVRDEEADRPVRLSPKLSGVLAALLSSSGAAVAEARLVDALWEGAQPRTAHKSLQVYVHHLRQALGGAEWIVREGRGYRLDTSAADVDAVRFAELDRRGRAAIADGDPQAGAELLREALGLWRGPAFSGLADMPLVREEAARLDERRWSAAEELARAELDLGRHAEVIAELTALVAEHPYRERLRAALMVALYRAGRSPEALEVYRRGRELLDRELGVEPGRELRDLESAILRGDASLDPTEASGPEGTAPAAPPRVPAQLDRKSVG